MESKVIQGKNVNEAEIKPSTNVEKKVIFQPYASVVFIFIFYFFLALHNGSIRSRFC